MYQSSLQGWEKGHDALLCMLFRGRSRFSMESDDGDDPKDADLIFQVYVSQSAVLVTGHMVAGASVTINSEDETRARVLARILDSITTLPAFAAVIGAAIRLEGRQLVDRQDRTAGRAVGMAPGGHPAPLPDVDPEKAAPSEQPSLVAIGWTPGHLVATPRPWRASPWSRSSQTQKGNGTSDRAGRTSVSGTIAAGSCSASTCAASESSCTTTRRNSTWR